MWPKSILLESQALSEVLKCVEGKGNCEYARVLTQEAFYCLENSDLSSLVIQCAMKQVLGKIISIEEFPKKFPKVHIFVETSRRWLSWVSGAPLEGPSFQEDSNGAIQHLALTYWSSAVEALLKGESQEAQRLFRRATEFSSSYGVQFNQAIHWTYAGSFFSITY